MRILRRVERIEEKELLRDKGHLLHDFFCLFIIFLQVLKTNHEVVKRLMSLALAARFCCLFQCFQCFGNVFISVQDEDEDHEVVKRLRSPHFPTQLTPTLVTSAID